MEAFLQISVVFLPLLYLVVAAGYGAIFFADPPRARRIFPHVFRGTLALHMVYLVVLTWRWQQFPAATVAQALSAVAFAVAVVYAFVEWRGGVTSTGFWVLAVACLFEILSSLLRTPNPPYREIFHSPLFSAHAGFGLLGYAAFAVAASYGFLFLRLYSEIKRRSFSVFFGKLPPLEVLERMMSGALAAGFVTLTLSLMAGIVWAEQIFHENWLRDPKILVTGLTWAFYGLVLGLRRSRRWHGRQTAIASLVGLVAVLFSAVGVNLFFTDVHGFL